MKKNYYFVLALLVLSLAGCGEKEANVETINTPNPIKIVENADDISKEKIEDATETYEKPPVEAEEVEVNIVTSYTSENDKYAWNTTIAEYSNNDKFRYVSGDITSKDNTLFASFAFSVNYEDMTAPATVDIQINSEESISLNSYEYPNANSNSLGEYVTNSDNVSPETLTEIEEILNTVITAIFY